MALNLQSSLHLKVLRLGTSRAPLLYAIVASLLSAASHSGVACASRSWTCASSRLISCARPGLFVGLRFFQFRRQFSLLRFEFLDFFFQFVNQLLLRLFFAGTRLTLLRFETFLFLAVHFHRRSGILLPNDWGLNCSTRRPCRRKSTPRARKSPWSCRDSIGSRRDNA